jgi:hypothetical protein
LLEGWLRYQRHEFIRKLRDLTPEGMVEWSVPPVELSVLGLVRHMTQMEHVYFSWGLGGGEQHLVYGDDDYAGGSVDTVDEDLRRYFSEVRVAEVAMTTMPSLDSTGRRSRATTAIHPGQDDRRVRPSRRSGPHAAVRRSRRTATLKRPLRRQRNVEGYVTR